MPKNRDKHEGAGRSAVHYQDASDVAFGSRPLCFTRRTPFLSVSMTERWEAVDCPQCLNLRSRDILPRRPETPTARRERDEAGDP